MGRFLSCDVLPQQAGTRLDVFLALNNYYASRSAAARAADSGAVFVNGETVNKKFIVHEGDTVVYQVEDKMQTGDLTGQPIDLDIRFEDDSVIVLSKQADLVCHPSAENETNTLVHALIYHCGIDNLCSCQGDCERLGIVHRLDRDTTGLMLAAKTDEAGYALMAAIRDRMVDRRYLALVHGIVSYDTGMIDAPLARAQHDRTRMAVRETPSSREAMTTFRVLERFRASSKDDGYTLIDCKLFTGRTHQIRAHMEYTRHPVVGDPVYSAGSPKAAFASLGLDRQFLHSFQIAFEHPETNKTLSFVDRLPEDLRAVLVRLSERSLGKTQAGEEVFTSINR